MEQRSKIFPILLVNFIGTMGYSIVLPFLVILVTKFGGNEVIYGILGATYSFFQLIGAPILGGWSDRFGRRKILLLSQAGTFIAWVVFLVALLVPNQILAEINNPQLGTFALSIPLVLLFLARALDGITGGNVSVANAYLSDVSTDENRKKNFGKMSASANLGFIIGPALAGILGGTFMGDLLPILMAMLISLMAIFVIFFQLKEYDPCKISASLDEQKNRKLLGQEHKECHGMEGASKVTLKDVMKLSGVPVILLLYFLIFLAFNFFYVAFPVHAVQTLEWDLFQVGVFFTLMSSTLVLVQGPVLSRISGWFSEMDLVLIGNLILAVGFYLFTYTNQWVLYGGVLIFSLGNGVMWPSFLSILSSAAGSKYQGAVQGFASSTGSLASIIGLLLGGFLYTWIGTKVFLLSVGTFLLISAFSFGMVKQSREISAENDSQ